MRVFTIVNGTLHVSTEEAYRRAIETAFGQLNVSDDEAERDLRTILDQCAPDEVWMVREHVRAGMLEGDCTNYCIVGVIAACRGQHYYQMAMADKHRPIEVWLQRIHAGMTPETSTDAAALDRWLSVWLEERSITSGPPMDTAKMTWVVSSDIRTVPRPERQEGCPCSFCRGYHETNEPS